MKKYKPRPTALHHDSIATSVKSQSSSRKGTDNGCEIVLLVAIILAGMGLRLAFPHFTTVEHFDEGVYASNLWFDEQSGFQYPLRHFYAPPLLPALIEGTMVLSGQITGWAAIVPSLIAGCLTIPLVWWLARSWFGPGAAVGSACLAAFSDVHAMFSRAALTDVLLLLFMSAAVGLFARACQTRRMSDFLIAGLVVGLAWWTKYNGWLPLIIALVALAAQWLGRRPEPTSSTRLLVGWFVTATTAALVWSPYLYVLQSYGGYAQIAANHRQYVVGPSGWLSSFSQQIANMNYIDSTLGSFGCGAAVFAMWIVRRTRLHEQEIRVVPRWREGLIILGCSVVVSLVAAWLGTGFLLLVTGMLAAFAVAGQYLLVTTPRGGVLPAGSSRDGPITVEQEQQIAGAWFVSSWFIVLLLLTPLYTPYLRLILPLLGGAWLASAWGADVLLRRMESRYCATAARVSLGHANVWHWIAITMVVAGGLVTVGISRPPIWLDDRRGLQNVAGAINEIVGQSGPSVNGSTEHRIIYVFGEPALLFHLRVTGQTLVLPVNTVQLQPVVQGNRPFPTYLVVGLHAMTDPTFRRDFDQTGDRFELLQTFPYSLSTTVLLDHYDPRRMSANDRRSQVRLYRVRGDLPEA